MPMNLLIDGIKFNLWKPNSETGDFAPIIIEHAKDIFGDDSLYFEIKPELRSNSGFGSKPDGFVIDFVKPALYVIEVERAEHGLHDYLYSQISKFNVAMKNPETRAKVIQALCEDIKGDC